MDNIELPQHPYLISYLNFGFSKIFSKKKKTINKDLNKLIPKGRNYFMERRVQALF